MLRWECLVLGYRYIFMVDNGNIQPEKINNNEKQSKNLNVLHVTISSVKDVQAIGEPSSPRKRVSKTSRQYISPLFLFLWVIFMPGSGSSRPISIRFDADPDPQQWRVLYYRSELKTLWYKTSTLSSLLSGNLFELSSICFFSVPTHCLPQGTHTPHAAPLW